MKSLHEIISEKLKIKKSSYKYFPESKEELKDLLKQLIEERGNDGDFNDIDVSNITDMSELFDFAGIAKFNGDISGWNVSKVKYNENIFLNCPIEEKYKPKFS